MEQNPQSRKKVSKPRNSKLDNPEVRRLIKTKGIKASDIAKHQGVAVSTVTRYLQSINQSLQTVKEYSTNKADILALSQAKYQAVIDIIVNRWLSSPEEYLLALEPRLQKEIMIAAASAKTFDHNQERLERGQATQITDYRAFIVEMSAAEATAIKRLKELKSIKKTQNAQTLGSEGQPIEIPY
jgi:hypothetical protein